MSRCYVLNQKKTTKKGTKNIPITITIAFGIDTRRPQTRWLSGGIKIGVEAALLRPKMKDYRHSISRALTTSTIAPKNHLLKKIVFCVCHPRLSRMSPAKEEEDAKDDSIHVPRGRLLRPLSSQEPPQTRNDVNLIAFGSRADVRFYTRNTKGTTEENMKKKKSRPPTHNSLFIRCVIHIHRCKKKKNHEKCIRYCLPSAAVDMPM